MAIKLNIKESNRGKLRVIFLGLIFLGCVALAWLVVEMKSSQARAGAKIIQQIRSDGLKKYWGDEPQLNCYVVFKAGRPISWYANSIAPRKEGGYGGRNVYRKYGPVGEGIVSDVMWQIDDHATSGKYISNSRISSDDGNLTVVIVLDENSVMVQQHVGAYYLEATSKCPKNYLPEDTVNLAIRLVARQKTTASFKVIYDEAAIHNGKIPFFTLNVEYLGPYTEVPGASQLAVTTSMRNSKSSEDICIVDAAGRIILRTVGDTAQKLVTLNELKKIFPDAPKILYLDKDIEVQGKEKEK